MVSAAGVVMVVVEILVVEVVGTLIEAAGTLAIEVVMVIGVMAGTGLTIGGLTGSMKGTGETLVDSVDEKGLLTAGATLDLHLGEGSTADPRHLEDPGLLEEGTALMTGTGRGGAQALITTDIGGEVL